ncbi:magnesium/cobalt transporter CorA [Ancylomarina longa]|uniref:Magnesium transport protein CorA n=1 Tax=Ancylomarina longa TaxID=2487017 RepID=A0A434AXN8_9BACT|nr:magnesium/cobalt transporter CorA [Ancylomarina longa]RUT79316.1 magnesium and cobalt transport protein CorA [Ancylomarina longa]
MTKKLLNRKKENPSIPVFTGIKYTDELSLQLFKYNKLEYFEDANYSNKKFKGFEEISHQYWLNIDGLHDTDQIKDICFKLGIHDLAIQDILDVNQRTKFQEYNKYLFFTLKSILPTQNKILEQEQLSFILGSNFLVSFQEKKANYFDHVRQQLRNNKGIIRERGSDYLLYLLLESILDNYFKTINEIENKIENLGFSDINIDPSPQSLKTIELFKRQVHQIKKTITPIKEFVDRIEREQFGFIDEKHIKYYYELKDLCLSLLDQSEQISVRLESNTNLYFSIQGYRMNQVMKILTIVATIFIPITFITGIYGMNFKYMPELNWELGYLSAWILIVVISIAMLLYFKRKNWF